MPRILHFGIGNFHRAHQAWYTARANRLSAQDWRITGVSLRSQSIHDLLKSQGFRYTLAVKSFGGTEYEMISVHDDILVGGRDTDAIVAAIADPGTACVTVTITEKGYYLDPSTGELDLDDPQLHTELVNGEPQTIYGFLARGLHRRAEQGGPPINVISCDNLPANGRKLGRALKVYCAEKNIDIADFVSGKVVFANTMVDRIVPATTGTLRAEVLAETGRDDAHPVSTEAFSQWYVEDVLFEPLPAWEQAGAVFVDDVAPFELRKLRLLNGSHSLLAYAGLLAGHEFVHEAVMDTAIRRKVEGFMSEAAATLPEESGDTAGDYCDALFDRFANPHLDHRLEQIAMDGSQKLPVRIVPVIRELEAQGTEPVFAREATTIWARFVVRQLRSGDRLDDPRAKEFADFVGGSEDDKDIIATLALMVTGA